MASCSEGGPFEFLTRPYPYKREPFQLAEGEKVTYEGIYFSIPASGLLLDKRLFTDADQHPVDSSIKLYINKDANVTLDIEPDDDGEIYQQATPHYQDYILDLRALIDDVTALHAADSDHTQQQFFEDHLRRVRVTYDLTGKEIVDGAYVHPESVATVPSGASPPGASGALQPPGDGHELGAQQIQDIDMDEVQWQAIARPTRQRTATPGNIPTEPVFPMVLPGGSLPGFTALDETNYSKLALNAPASGGVLVTGDGLVTGTSIKLFDGSGAMPLFTGNFLREVPWKLFPCERELCNYYAPHEDPTATISARGRQSVYAAPGGSLSNGVYLLAASESTETSGLAVQHFPANYYATSGVDANGHAHKGIHVTDKLLYNINSLGGNIAIGFSPINGERVFGHFPDNVSAGSKGETLGGAGPKYANGDTIYGAGSIVNPALSNFTRSTVNWVTTNNRFSPATWATLSTTALGPTRGIFGAPNGTTYATADVMASTSRIVRRKVYAQWGFIDQIVTPDLDQGQGGQRITYTITYNTIQYREGKDAEGNFAWVEEDRFTSQRQGGYWNNTFGCNNIFSFFFLRKPNNGFVHVADDVYIQWSNKTGFTDNLPRKNNFAPIPTAGAFNPTPTTTRSDVRYSIGFFPAWKLIRYVTTNNQVFIPGNIPITPANSKIISFDPDLDFDDTFVTDFGPPVYDPDEGINYIYFLWNNGAESRLFFAHMDNDFVIFRINQVSDNNGILFGRMALLSV